FDAVNRGEWVSHQVGWSGSCSQRVWQLDVWLCAYSTDGLEPLNRMLKSSASFVLGSSKSSTYPPGGTPPVSTRLRPCLGEGASWRARVGRVRCLDLLSILRGCIFLFQTCRRSKIRYATMIFCASLVSAVLFTEPHFDTRGDRLRSACA